jgi:hypothetical protein
MRWVCKNLFLLAIHMDCTPKESKTPNKLGNYNLKIVLGIINLKAIFEMRGKFSKEGIRKLSSR